jgi:hypothetical protein
MTERTLKECVRQTRSSLMNSSVSFFGERRYGDFFDRDGNLTINENITDIIRQYHALDLWNKIVCYLTTPVSQYLVLNDIIALQRMENASIEQTFSIHDEYHLGQHVRFIGWILDSIHDELESKLNELRVTHLPDAMTRLTIMDKKLEKIQTKLLDLSAQVTWIRGEVTAKTEGNNTGLKM